MREEIYWERERGEKRMQDMRIKGRNMETRIEKLCKMEVMRKIRGDE